MKKENALPIRKAVGIWIRVSTEDQARGDSPELHEKRARHYAESQAWDVVEVYHLEGVSGKAVSDHPEAHRMLKDLRAGRITGLIFTKLARLARNTRELLDFAEHFRQAQANLISLEERFDTSTPAGMLFFTLIAAMAQWEREEIASRIVSSIKVRAQLGKPLNGSASFGYHWKDKKLVPHPDEAPIRKLMYELFDQEKRLKRVAKVLNERGYRTRKGAHWTDTSIRYLLKDPTAKGEHRAMFTLKSADRKQSTIKAPEEWVITPVEPLVSVDVWNRCNEVLDQRRTTFAPPGPKPIHLFSGLLHCGCGLKMYVRTNAPYRYQYFKCGNKIDKDTLEKAYIDRLKGYFLSPEQIADNLKEANVQLAEKERLLESLEKEVSKVKGEMDRIYRLYQDGQIDGKGFGEFYKPLRERLDQLNEELPVRQAEVDYQAIQGLSVETVLDEAKTVYDVWPKMDLEAKRKIVEALTEKVVIGQEDIEITLKAAISSVESVKRQSQSSRLFGGAHC